MCLNDKHLWTMSLRAAFAGQYGAPSFALSTINVESRTDGVNGTSVLLGLGAKGLFFNDIPHDGSEVV